MKVNTTKNNFKLNKSNPTIRYIKWREDAKRFKLNIEERLRVEWMIFFESQSKKNVSKTCNHFGISKTTFYKWFHRFTAGKQDIRSLKSIPKIPHRARNWDITTEQERRILQLRKKYIHYGKRKLKILYRKKYGEEISIWKVERVVRKHKLYPPQKKKKENRRKTGHSKREI